MAAPIIGDRSRVCRGCWCTNLRACPGGCSWVLLDIETPTGVCSRCAEEAGWDTMSLATIGFDEIAEAMRQFSTPRGVARA